MITERRYEMRRIIVASLLTFALFGTFGLVANAEMEKEGEGICKTAMSWTMKTIPMGKERLHANFEVTGVVVEAPADSPLFNATFYALGSVHAIKGAYEESGFIRWTRPDGDQIFATYNVAGKMGGERKITQTFVGGTGKCAGITGGGEAIGIRGLRPATKEIRMAVSVGKFHWKIP
jgi:hypothetical protein